VPAGRGSLDDIVRILFMTDETLEIGAIYKIAESESTNRFRCVATHDPNGTMFVREHDGMEHLGREFIEYRNGERYYAVEKVSSANAQGDSQPPAKNL
jgi:hypothetical protein